MGYCPAYWGVMITKLTNQKKLKQKSFYNLQISPFGTTYLINVKTHYGFHTQLHFDYELAEHFENVLQACCNLGQEDW